MKVLAGPQSPLMAQLGVDLLSKLPPGALAGLCSTSAVDCRPSSDPSHLGLSTGQLTTRQLLSSGEQVRRRERASKTKLQSFVMVVTSLHLCHILSVRSESLSPAHTRGGCDTRP